MSDIYTEINRIQEARNQLRTKGVSLGITSESDNITDIAASYNNIVDNGTVDLTVESGSSITLDSGYYHGGTVTGIGGNTGMWGIDETNILVNRSTAVKEYTATEDCYCTFSTNWGEKTGIRINGIAIEECLRSPGGNFDIWLKSGQTLTLIATDNKQANITKLRVFGLKQ